MKLGAALLGLCLLLSGCGDPYSSVTLRNDSAVDVIAGQEATADFAPPDQLIPAGQTLYAFSLPADANGAQLHVWTVSCSPLLATTWNVNSLWILIKSDLTVMVGDPLADAGGGGGIIQPSSASPTENAMVA